MDEDLRERVEAAAEKHALLNAVKHGSDAEVGAVMGPLMGKLRGRVDGALVQQVVRELLTEEERAQ